MRDSEKLTIEDDIQTVRWLHDSHKQTIVNKTCFSRTWSLLFLWFTHSFRYFTSIDNIFANMWLFVTKIINLIFLSLSLIAKFLHLGDEEPGLGSSSPAPMSALYSLRQGIINIPLIGCLLVWLAIVASSRFHVGSCMIVSVYRLPPWLVGLPFWSVISLLQLYI
jgi:hypothetical protein